MDITFDIIVLIVFLFFTIRGTVRGAISELIGLVGLFAGIYLAGAYAPVLEPHLNYSYLAGYQTIVAYALIFIGSMIAVTIVGAIIRKVFHLLFLGFLDHFLGGAIGFIKALLIIMLVKTVVVNFFPDTDFVQESISIPYRNDAYDLIITHLPDSVKDIFRELDLDSELRSGSQQLPTAGPQIDIGSIRPNLSNTP